jgi:hypothetical protein
MFCPDRVVSRSPIVSKPLRARMGRGPWSWIAGLFVSPSVRSRSTELYTVFRPWIRTMRRQVGAAKRRYAAKTYNH